MPRKEMPEPVVQDRENIEALRSEAARLRSEIAEYARRQFKNGLCPIADDAMAMRSVRARILTKWADGFEPDVALRERWAADARYREQERVAKVERVREADADRARRNAAAEWLNGRLADGPQPRQQVERDAAAAGHDIDRAVVELCEEVEGAFIYGSASPQAHTLYLRLIRGAVAA